jgi:hypothetical protein
MADTVRRLRSWAFAAVVAFAGGTVLYVGWRIGGYAAGMLQNIGVALVLFPLLVLAERTFARMLSRTVAEQIDKVESDNRQEALQDAKKAFSEVGEEERVPAETGPSTTSSVRAQERLDELIKRYNEIRSSQSAGPQRTADMTRVVLDMIQLADKLPNFNWQQNLESRDRGARLAAYSHLYGRPTEGAAIPLIRALTLVEDKPFGQYWALKSLEQQPSPSDCQSAQYIERTLGTFISSLLPGTDRYAVATRYRHTIGEVVRSLCHQDSTLNGNR